MKLFNTTTEGEDFYRGKLFVGRNTSESIIMTRRTPTTETRIVLRTILSAGVLAVLLACAGTAAEASAGTGAKSNARA